jgi:glycogen debranching enzyme
MAPETAWTMGTGPDPWSQGTESASLGAPADRVMLLAGQMFCLSDATGAIHPGLPHGLFVGDTRALSQHDLRIDGRALESLGVAQATGSGATFVGRTGSIADAHRLLVVRRRSLVPLLAEAIELRSRGPRRHCTVQLGFAADFADLFSVKQGDAHPVGKHSTTVAESSLSFGWRLGSVGRTTAVGVEVSAGAIDTDANGFTWTVEVPESGAVTARWRVQVSLGGDWLGRSLGPLTSGPFAASPDHEGPVWPDEEEWIEQAPVLDTDDPGLARAYRRAVTDLASLRLFDPARSRLPVVAAGAPWFMTLFGRDSLWTSLMALPVDPTLALGVLDALAELQGQDVDHRTEEEPGRIMHETRFEGANTLALEGGTIYYGSVDATPLFVVLLGELARWGLPEEDLRRLLPHADRALAWIEDFGDRDGDGYVEYLRANPRGLSNQGWKDSWDAVRHRDGRVAAAPIALCEVQGYLYAAYRARAGMAAALGQPERAARWQRKADALRRAFNEDFWIDELGWFAMGLDRDKRRIGALASNMGHCLWSGIVDDDKAALVVERLGGPTMWSGWGVRTMAADEAAFDPTSYHCGSVWPHDSAIAVAGIARYGHAQVALTILEGLLAAADHSDGRLPELFLGLDRRDVGIPVSYPTSCSPQAWSAAAPFLLLRVLLGLEPDLPSGSVGVAPSLPEGMDRLVARGLRLWDGRMDVACRDGATDVNLPAGVRRSGRSISGTLPVGPPAPH